MAKWGTKGHGAGLFDMPHDVAVAAGGAVNVGDINGRRVQKFVPVAGPSPVPAAK